VFHVIRQHSPLLRQCDERLLRCACRTQGQPFSFHGHLSALGDLLLSYRVPKRSTVVTHEFSRSTSDDTSIFDRAMTGLALCRGGHAADLSGLQIDGLRAARVRLDVKRHALTFRQAAHAGGFDSRRVDEHVLRATLRRDKTKAFLRIEEFDDTNSLHVIVPVHRGIPPGVCSSGANRRNHQIEKDGCLSQARNKYGRVG